MVESREGLAWPPGSVEALYDEVRRASNPAPEIAPTPAVGCILWRHPDPAGLGLEIFLVQRSFSHPFLGGFWGFPVGRVESSELDPASVCAREVRSDLGLVLPETLRGCVPLARFVTPAFWPIRFDTQYFLVETPRGATPDPHVSREHRVGEWIAPGAALDRFSRGDWIMPPPVVEMLAALVPGREGAAERLAAAGPLDRERRLWWLADGIAVCPLRTPTLPPATHTNTYVIGAGGDLVIIDPASPYEEERAALDRALEPLLAGGARVLALLLTHHHLDHVSGASHLAARLGAPIWAHADTARLLAGRIQVDRLLGHDETIELAGSPRRCLRALHTPGHAPGHLCFIEEETRFIAVGDMVASVGTILIDPGAEGDMRLYLDSLHLLARTGARVLLPAHGLPLPDPAAKLEEYVRHRTWREERVMAELAGLGRAFTRDLVPRVYADVAPPLYGLAERSLLAHLVKLAADGRVQREGDEWLVAA